MSEALTSLKGYRSLRVKGEFRSDGGYNFNRVDLHVDRQGNCAGSYMPSHPPTTKFVIIGDRAWLAHDDEFLEEIRTFAKNVMPDKVAGVEEAIKRARGKYIEYSVRDLDYPSLILCDLDRLFAGVPEKVDSAEEVGNPRTKGGVRTVQLTHARGDGELAVHVPEKGKPVPRGIEFEIDGDPVLLEFEDYDEPVRVRPPRRADTVLAEEVRGLDVLAD
ncbi:hypothetical protein [Streptomyces sp. NPDC052042]|uniref:hypothetical protein n=1 Tax=Streptomyces sp. NPDC052042 TaxID=3365683 RepID=UPI0037D05034